MATYVLIPGAGGRAWYWHRLVPELRARGHDVVAVQLPADDDTAGLSEYADTVCDAIGGAANVLGILLAVIAVLMGALSVWVPR